MGSVKTITRKELINEGANTYLVRLLTHHLHPIRIEQSVNIYRLNDVIMAIRKHLGHPRTQPQTRAVLEALLGRLILRLDNVVRAPFGKSVDERIGFHIDRILGRKIED
ncbi:MAG: hypothetical protein HC810_05575 [Acaryochloridaceae cyanobacterium RL_2_7]|nr:hypothetical protein [Acaryochloridaceae cyanobacterium RL_2_7]